ncbi:conserved hypothetical protein [Uncinocarpus reesii 1704]|uniref:Phosphoglucomutase-2 n=1 Tax=Uncinocarpus reesii (strain UAMH 1704) TaxID=336963 RepID=C4JX36_UNCRE|nr:uncharacterized protein UREG_06209 [Uncinocarpus reesii 1704]EEP81344.1 conserved hypothetical protein [Uncinocarpus reesii 1704]
MVSDSCLHATSCYKAISWPSDPHTREEIKSLYDANNISELERRLRHRIQFGTAGLRGRMQAGFAYMNSLTVIQASQGLCKFLKESHQGPEPLSVVIGRDARHNSERFAQLATNALEAEGIRVWSFDSPVPTPLVPYTVLLKKATAGIVITASHADIGHRIPHKTMTSTAEIGDSPGRFVYTPLHGVGHSIMSMLCKKLNIQDMTVVPEQRDPDPEFPTVRFPNPEEAGALDLAMKTADDMSINLIVANDPDADRFAIAQKVGKTWFKFTGDQVGVLLASHLLDIWKQQSPQKPMAMLSTAVSSNMLGKMAKMEGFHFQETLTGFKWLGNAAKRLEAEGYDVPFAFEEALGYMFCKVCYDKDGLTAAMVFLAAQAQWKKQGLNPFTKLQQLYETYGYHETLNTYFVSSDPSISANLFQCIRGFLEDKRKSIGKFPVIRWRDVSNGLDTGAPNNTPELPIDSTSQMLTVWSDHGLRFTLRSSGTEPKVKIYIESCCPAREDAVAAVCEVFSAVLMDWIRPFAPNMTYAPTVTTSSGHIFTIP